VKIILAVITDQEKINLFFKAKKKKKIQSRFKVFAIKGKRCKHCGIEGNSIVLSFESNVLQYDLFHITDETKIRMTIDHIIPVSKGGSKNSLANQQTLCEPCNNKKADLLPEGVTI
jgi:5-methylcytosine-specific restriction endonuclease McrA